MSCGDYVLVTAVRDEEATIGVTLESVIGQTIAPREWVIVSDGSTDGTDEIVERASRDRGWVRLIRLPQRNERSFGAMVAAIKVGVSRLDCGDYGYLGLLDGDLRLRRRYFEEVLGVMRTRPRLGIAGGMVVDEGEDPRRLPWNRLDVPGAVQMFRRECYEAVDGYLPIPEGGFDTVACVQARLLGFETRLLAGGEFTVDHLKPRNRGAGGALRRKWQMGSRDYALGYHWLFELVKCASRVGERPLVLGAVARLAGYASSAMRRRERMVPAPVVDWMRREQVRRLKGGRFGREAA